MVSAFNWFKEYTSWCMQDVYACLYKKSIKQNHNVCVLTKETFTWSLMVFKEIIERIDNCISYIALFLYYLNSLLRALQPTCYSRHLP